MLQCQWPTEWSLESREAIRSAIEKSIRKTMSRGGNSQIRGTVSVDLPHLGNQPPELTLSGIRNLSVEHTALMVHAHYSGDFQVTLRGLSINLDTVSSNNGDEADPNKAFPFFFPFEMTLKNVVLDGMVSVEIFQEVESTDGVLRESRSVSGSNSNTALLSTAQAANTEMISANRPVEHPSRGGTVILPSNREAAPSSGYGVLLGAGGRRAMRPPDAHELLDTSKAVPNPAPPEQSGVRRDEKNNNTTGVSLASLLSKKAKVTKKSVKLQCFVDPVKHFSIFTNFGTIPAADKKVEGLLRMLITPTIERIMTEGITIPF